MDISIKLIENGTEYIANCPELDINCYGSNEVEAMRRIKEVINFYVNSAKEMGINISPLNDGNKTYISSGHQEICDTIN